MVKIIPMDNHMKTQEKSAISFCKESTSKKPAGAAPKLYGSAYDKRGFTLLELIMVVALIAVLATLSIPSYTNLKNSAKNGRCKAEIRTIEKVILASFTDKGRLPATLSVAGPEAAINDPWGHPYVYFDIADAGGAGTPYIDFNTQNLNTDFDLYSMGQDGDTAHDLTVDPSHVKSYDDIVRCNDGASVELGRDRNGT